MVMPTGVLAGYGGPARAGCSVVLVTNQEHTVHVCLVGPVNRRQSAVKATTRYIVILITG